MMKTNQLTPLLDILGKYKKIIVVGGGTGGHIQPIISLMAHMKISASKKQEDFLWIGGNNSLEEKLAHADTIPFQSIHTLKLATTRSPKIVLYPIYILLGIIDAIKILAGVLKTYKKEEICIFSKGGPGSVSVCLAGKLLGIPIYIHESDTVPGRSNRLLGHMAKCIFLGFDSAKQFFAYTEAYTVGQIIHPDFFDSTINTPAHNDPRKNLLVICGSQGAKSIFEAILEHLDTLLQKYNLTVILGKLNENMKSDFEDAYRILRGENTRDAYGTLTLHNWISQATLVTIIPMIDLAITRGSATTLAELTARRTSEGTPKLIIVPLPHSAGNHQYYNAFAYSEQYGDTLLEQKDLNSLRSLLETIE